MKNSEPLQNLPKLGLGGSPRVFCKDVLMETLGDLAGRLPVLKGYWRPSQHQIAPFQALASDRKLASDFFQNSHQKYLSTKLLKCGALLGNKRPHFYQIVPVRNTWEGVPAGPSR